MDETTDPAARFVRSIDWVDSGVWLRADTHFHTRFSDGRWPLDRVLEGASKHGCDVVAVTDHAHQEFETATPVYAEAIETARRERPDLIVLAGLEWNVPPYGGDEHATLIVAPGPDEWSTLAEFRERFDDDGTRSTRKDQAVDAIRWLSNRTAVEPVILYNHPSRKLPHSLDLVPIFETLREDGDVLVGFSGAPGHQESDPVGAYRSGTRLVDRWDPAAATAGSAWDTLLQKGLDVWAARAPSDFHRADPGRPDDYWPCEFSETWLLAPERSSGGALRALRAGTFFAVHGKIARDVRLEVAAPGLDRPAGPGEVIGVPREAPLDIVVTAHVPPTDWQGRPNRIDTVEIFLVESTGVKTVPLEPAPGEPGRFTTQVVHPGGDIVIRARGRRRIADGDDLLFYTNPVRVTSP